jgi:hypothetical protein
MICINSHVDDKVCSFATKDIDCPVVGCYGFRITLPGPGTFNIASNQAPTAPPIPGLFSAETYFQNGNVTFTSAIGDVAGSCLYSPAPTQPAARGLLMPGFENPGPEEQPNQ